MPTLRTDVPLTRVRTVVDAPSRPAGAFVLYWMTAARRVDHNWALEHALAWARALGRPLVVSDVGWYSELPDDAVAKVAVGPNEVDQLAETLTSLCTDAELRERLGAAGEAYARNEHDLGKVADAYVAALEEAAGLELVRKDVLGEVARAASDVGLDSSNPELTDVAKALSEVGLGD